MIYFDTDLKNYALKMMFANKNRARKSIFSGADKIQDMCSFFILP